MVKTFTVRPEDFGIPRASIEDLRGGDREQNAQIIRGILDGEPGPRRDIVLMNAAAALVAGGKGRDLKDGVTLAAHSIDTHAARAKLEDLIGFSRALAGDK
jgi:anthranilate phosphoribosyltransferase